MNTKTDPLKSVVPYSPTFARDLLTRERVQLLALMTTAQAALMNEENAVASALCRIVAERCSQLTALAGLAGVEAERAKLRKRDALREAREKRAKGMAKR